MEDVRSVFWGLRNLSIYGGIGRAQKYQVRYDWRYKL